MADKRSHICVCICTYKRPKLLENLLRELQNQTTDGLFTYSIVVTENDSDQTLKNLVLSYKKQDMIDIEYCCEPEQNIALARNKAIQNAKGNFIAFIDDDEVPGNNWLITLYHALNEYKVNGVLGPVKPHFATEPPLWIVKGKFYERKSHETGFIIQWKNARMGNVLLKKEVINDPDNRFRSEFGRGGEDRDFFRRVIEKGYVFVWCNEAPVYETIPPERWTRSFMIKRALLRGKIALLHPPRNTFNVLKSLIAILIYTFSLPFLFVIGQQVFMKYLIKDCDHIGKILAVFRLDIIKQKYVMK